MFELATDSKGHEHDATGRFTGSGGGAKAPDRIREHVAKNYAKHHVGRVTQDLLDVATGTREGNEHERQTLKRIFPDWTPAGEEANDADIKKRAARASSK